MRKRSKKTEEIGRIGLPIIGGQAHDDPVAKLTQAEWRKTVRLMTANDSTIRSMLFLIEMIARQVTWKVMPWDDKSENDELAVFIRECLFEDMEGTWQDTVAEILSMLPWGWSWFEIVYKRRAGSSNDRTLDSRYSDGRIGWRKWAIRSQESLYEWKFADDSDDIVAMVQSPAPNYEIFSIPWEKSLHFRTSTHKNNPEGQSILRGAYRNWWRKTNFENIEGIGIERDLAGLPKIGAPLEIFKQNATPEQLALKAHLENLGKNIRQDEAACILYPLEYNDKGHKKYEIELMTTGGSRQFNIGAVIDREDQRMLMSVMADFLLLGSKSVGSYALADKKWDAFLKAMKTWLDAVCEVVNRHAIPRLLTLNGKSTEKAPYLAAGTLEDISLENLGKFVNVLRTAGITFTDEQSDWLKRKGGIPVKDD